MLTAEIECSVISSGSELDVKSVKTELRFTSESTKTEKELKLYFSKFHHSISSMRVPPRKLFLTPFFSKGPNFGTTFEPLNNFCKRRASYHFKA